jgi:hypothetical protein
LAKANQIIAKYFLQTSICFGRKSRWNQNIAKKNMVKWSKWK